MIKQDLTTEELTSKLEECRQARRELFKELTRERSEKAVLAHRCEDFEKQVKELQHELDDLKWNKRMEGVSKKRIPTPAKKVLTALRKTQISVPHTEEGDWQYHTKEVAKEAKMAPSTAYKWIKFLEDNKLFKRRRAKSGNHTSEDNNAYYDTVFGEVEPQMMYNPNNVYKFIPVDRKDRRGGDHRSDKFCTNCGSPHINGQRHDSYLCEDCQVYSDDRYVLPLIPAQQDTLPEGMEPQPRKLFA